MTVLECLKSWCIAAHIRQSRHESTKTVTGILHYRHAVAIANQANLVKADAISILQHMGSSWQVTQSGEFEQASELTGGAQLIGKTIDGWFDRVSQEQREWAINQIYDIFAAAGYGNIADLVANWTDSLPKIVAAARGTDVQTRELIKDVFKAIPASAAKVAVGELRNDKEGDA
mgnify:CR=1 FL=1